MSHRFPNVYLTRCYKNPIRAYTINIFVRQNFYRVRSYKVECSSCKIWKKWTFLCRIWSDMIKKFIVEDLLNCLTNLSQATHNLISTYKTKISYKIKILTCLGLSAGGGLHPEKNPFSLIITICSWVFAHYCGLKHGCFTLTKTIAPY